MSYPQRIRKLGFSPPRPSLNLVKIKIVGSTSAAKLPLRDPRLEKGIRSRNWQKYEFPPVLLTGLKVCDLSRMTGVAGEPVGLRVEILPATEPKGAGLRPNFKRNTAICTLSGVTVHAATSMEQNCQECLARGD